MVGGNEAQRSDRMELPKDSKDEGERHVFRQVEAVTTLRYIAAITPANEPKGESPYGVWGALGSIAGGESLSAP